MGKVADIIRQKTDLITNLWKESVEKEIPGTKETEPLVLLNIMPQLLEDMAIVLERPREQEFSLDSEEYQKIIYDSQDHGLHRASTANFSTKKIIREYRILHRVLIKVLISEEVYNKKVAINLSLIIEVSMEYSVSSFSRAMQEMREKLTGTLAHDIRNPLTAANLGLAGLRYGDSEEKFDKIKGMISSSLRRSIVLVEDLLDTVSVASGEGICMNFSFCNFVEEVKLVFLEASNSYHREFKLECEESDIRGVFDPTAVRRVLENLLTNAVKYGEPKKPITVTIKNELNKVILKVHNEGNSIGPQDRKDIFDFLNRSQKTSNGQLKSWGIGLSFVKMAAEAHGGHVDVESDEEKGTTFSVTFLKNSNEPGKKRTVLNLKDSTS